MKQTLSMIVFVLVLGSLLTTALVAIDSFTRPRIEANRLRRVYGGILTALEIDYTRETIEDVFRQAVTEKTADGETFYVAASGEVAFEISGMGVWGPLHAVVALKPDLRTLSGLTIVKHEETPGLGSRIAEPGYLAAFKGKVFEPALRITKEGQADAPHEVDGITGATLSCDALGRILNDELARLVPRLQEATP